jgi:hypothetical protein
MTTTTTETEPFEFGAPRIGGVDIDTWQAVPAPKPGDCDPEERLGGYCVVAGDSDEAAVWIEVTAEYPQAVAEFIVTAVQNEYARQTWTLDVATYLDALAADVRARANEVELLREERTQMRIVLTEAYDALRRGENDKGSQIIEDLLKGGV